MCADCALQSFLAHVAPTMRIVSKGRRYNPSSVEQGGRSRRRWTYGHTVSETISILKLVIARLNATIASVRVRTELRDAEARWFVVVGKMLVPASAPELGIIALYLCCCHRSRLINQIVRSSRSWILSGRVCCGRAHISSIGDINCV